MSSVTNQRLIIISRANHFVRRPFVRAPHREVGGTLHQHGLFTEKVNKVKEIRTKVSLKQNDPVLNNLGFPVLVPDLDLKNVHPVIKSIFQGSVIQQFPLAGRLKNFQRAWEKLTKDQEILSIIKGYQIPFITNPIQNSVRNVQMKKEQKVLVDKEVSDMLRKGAIRLCQNQPNQYLSTLFLVGKKDGGYRPVINLKQLNKFIPYQHFKMEGLHYLKYMLKEGDYMCKLDMKDAYFSVPLSQISREKVRFQWSGKLYEFLCLCFGLGPAPRIFTKILKVPMSLLRRLNILIIIYLDDMLLLGRTREETVRAKDTVIYLLQHLGFVINLKKSVLEPTQKIEFLGLIVNSQDLSLSLTQEKLQKVKTRCLEMYKAETVSILELTKLIGLLCSTTQAVLPAQLQLRYLQKLQIKALQKNQCYHHQVVLDADSKQELMWWIQNLTICNGRCLVQTQPQIIIQTDASKTGWGASCQGMTTRGVWSNQEKELHINVLELLAVKLALLSFMKDRVVKSIHFQIDNTTAIRYLAKMGGTHNSVLLKLSKEIWKFLLERGITITTEYLPSKLNVIADRESRARIDSSEWKMCPKVFSQVCQKLGTPQIDLFVLSNKQGLAESLQGKDLRNNNSDSNMAHTTLVPATIRNVNRETSVVTKTKQSSQRSFRESTSLNSQQNTQISGVESFRERLSMSGISGTASKLISSSRRHSSSNNYESSWRKWVGWCSKKQIDPIHCNVNAILNFLGELFEAGYEYRTINCHRSAISAYHDLVDGKKIGSHVKVCELLTGVFNSRPPQPKYTFIWDVQVVLDYIKEVWADNKSISDKCLSLKLTMLIALVSAFRAIQIQHLDISQMGRLSNQYKFAYTKLHKGWRKGKSSPTVLFSAFLEDPQLCVVNCLDEYLLRSKGWRNGHKNQLLLSHINPHKEVSSSTISRWLRETLDLSGVTNLGEFGGHSTRSASTSKAEISGLSVKDILDRGSWSNESTWQKFYHKEVISVSKTFQGKVLNSKML